MNKNLQQAREKLDAKLAPARAWYEQREPREQRILQALALLVAAFDRLASSLRGLRRRAEASLATQTATALRAALMGTSSAEQQQQSLPQRPESLPALGRSDGSMQMQDASNKAAASVESKRRHSSMGVLLREDAPPPSNGVRLPALQRHRFP